MFVTFIAVPIFDPEASGSKIFLVRTDQWFVKDLE
jgi:hypothetical protein